MKYSRCIMIFSVTLFLTGLLFLCASNGMFGWRCILSSLTITVIGYIGFRRAEPKLEIEMKETAINLSDALLRKCQADANRKVKGYE